MMRTRFAHLALLPLATLGAACQTDTVACQQDSDCFLTEQCSGGFCEARPSTEPDTGSDTDSELDTEADTGDAIAPPPDLTTLCPASQRPAETGRYEPIAVAAGPEHVCAIDAEGRLLCWGQNERGQLGDETLEPRYVPTRVAHACRWNRIAIGGQTTCALTIDSQLFCWGDNRYGQLGQGDFVDRSLPHQIPGEWNTVTVGPDRVCARDRQEDTWCWGNNGIRRNLLGAENLGQREPSPVLVIDDFDALNISIGDDHTCVVNRDTMAARCWGNNSQGQIGPEGPSAGSATPFFTMRNFTWNYISASGDHVCGVLTGMGENNLYCWGGDGSAYGLNLPEREEAPHHINAPDHFGSTIKTSGTHTCSTYFSGANGGYGELLCWGDNTFGQADPTSDLPFISAPQAVEVNDNNAYFNVVSDGLSCALSGAIPTLQCWGDNEHGRLATGNTAPQTGVVVISLAPR